MEVCIRVYNWQLEVAYSRCIWQRIWQLLASRLSAETTFCQLATIVPGYAASRVKAHSLEPAASLPSKFWRRFNFAGAQLCATGKD